MGALAIMFEATKKSSTSKINRQIIVVCAAAFLATGCSSVPDWANPAEWYRDTKDWVTGSSRDSAQPPQAATPIPNADKNFPKLSSVPARPAAPSEADRKKMAKSLTADRQAARYSDDQIRRQGDAVTRAPAPAPVAKTPPAVVPKPVVRATPPAQVARSVPRPAPVPQRAPVAKPVERMAQPVFRQAPADIIRRAQPVAIGGGLTAPLAAPSATSRQVFVQAKPFSTRFPAGAGTVASPVLTGAGNKIATVLFKVGSSKLSSAARQDIRKAAALYKQRGGNVHVIGHASSRTRNLDPRRHQLANFRVSYDRANAVARELRRLGVAATAIRVSALSDSQPVFLEVMPAGEAGNRRAEIVLEN
ncbi:MAG: hypothetical protein CMM52_05990 [Rhodospirillaceae bacterium]|nr:hypothetical protein [Rhodospirillaceae bacterium]|tara:strand:+ start:7458 stop:8543 length:1086 start_codon:yes stop_codon:yes gene_type:complete